MSAIPFITCNKDDQFEISQEATKFLSTVHSPLAIVVIGGVYRSGKSLLLNKCVLNLRTVKSGFPVGNTVTACTKGIWMYTKPIEVEGKHLIVLDVEGAFSMSASRTHDSKILLLSLLLSSYFIYNSVKAIDTVAIQTLSLVTNLSKMVDVSTDTDNNNNHQALASIMPKLHWLVRDFALELTNEQGEKMTPCSYLEQVLGESKGEYAGVKKCISDSFPERYCSTLPYPYSQDENSRIPSIEDSRFRPSFVNEVNNLRDYIYKNTPVKEIKSNTGTVPVSGTMLLELAAQYLAAINSGTVPAIKDTWTLIVNSQQHRVSEEIICSFQSAVTGLPVTCPLEFKKASTGLLRLKEHNRYTKWTDKSAQESLRKKLKQIAADMAIKNTIIFNKSLQADKKVIEQTMVSCTSIQIAQQSIGMFYNQMCDNYGPGAFVYIKDIITTKQWIWISRCLKHEMDNQKSDLEKKFKSRGITQEQMSDRLVEYTNKHKRKTEELNKDHTVVVSRMKDEVQSLQKSKQDALNLVDKIKTENQEVKLQYGKLIKEIEIKLHEAEDETSTSKEVHDEISKENETLNITINELKSKTSKFNEITKHNTDQSDLIGKLRAELKTEQQYHQSAICDLRKQTEASLADISRKKKEYERRIHTKIIDKEQCYTTTIEKLRLSKVEIEKHMEEAETRHTKSNGELNNVNTELQLRFSNLEEKYIKSKEDSKILQRKHEQLVTELQKDKDMYNAQMYKKQSDCSDQISKLQTELHNHKEDSFKVQSKLSDKLHTSQTMNTQLEVTYTSTKRKLEDIQMKQPYKKLKNTHQQQQIQLAALQTERQCLLEKVGTLQADIENTNNILSTTRREQTISERDHQVAMIKLKLQYEAATADSNHNHNWEI